MSRASRKRRRVERKAQQKNTDGVTPPKPKRDLSELFMYPVLEDFSVHSPKDDRVWFVLSKLKNVPPDYGGAT